MSDQGEAEKLQVPIPDRYISVINIYLDFLLKKRYYKKLLSSDCNDIVISCLEMNTYFQDDSFQVYLVGYIHRKEDVSWLHAITDKWLLREVYLQLPLPLIPDDVLSATNFLKDWLAVTDNKRIKIAASSQYPISYSGNLVPNEDQQNSLDSGQTDKQTDRQISKQIRVDKKWSAKPYSGVSRYHTKEFYYLDDQDRLVKRVADNGRQITYWYDNGQKAEATDSDRRGLYTGLSWYPNGQCKLTFKRNSNLAIYNEVGQKLFCGSYRVSHNMEGGEEDNLKIGFWTEYLQ